MISVAENLAQTMDDIFEMKTKLYGYDEVSEQAMARYYIEMTEELVYRAHLKVSNQQASAEEIRLNRELESALEPVFKLRNRLID